MEQKYNYHYVTTDKQGHIISGWSNGPHPERDTANAICINEQGGYQFRVWEGGEENPPLYTMDGIPLWRWSEEDQRAYRRMADQIEADRAAIPDPPPTDKERMEAQITYTAMMTDTLLEEG